MDPRTLVNTAVPITRVAEPRHLNMDPDPAFPFNADPDPGLLKGAQA